jgi:hypothetical protein
VTKHKDEETKISGMEMQSRFSDAKSAPATASDQDEAHHVVHLESERLSRLRKRPTRY